MLKTTRVNKVAVNLFIVRSSRSLSFCTTLNGNDRASEAKDQERILYEEFWSRLVGIFRKHFPVRRCQTKNPRELSDQIVRVIYALGW